MKRSLLYTAMLLAISASSASSSSLSDLKGIIKEWGEEHASQKGLKFKWAELYKGTTTHPDEKLFARVVKTEYERDVERNSQTQLVNEIEKFKDNRRSQSDSKAEVNFSHELNTSYSITVTKGLDIELPISAMGGYPPFGTASITLNPKFSWNKTRQTLNENRHDLGLKEEVIVPARHAQRVKLSIHQVTYDVPVTGEVEISGSVVCCFRPPFHHKKGKPAVHREESGEEKSISEVTPLSMEEILSKIEKEYPHFPDLDQSTLEDIQQRVEEGYLKTSEPQEQELERAKDFGEEKSKSTLKPRSEHSFWKWLKRYQIEAFPIKSIIREFFEKHPDHPDKGNYNYHVPGDRILFATEGLLEGAQRIMVTPRVISDYSVEEYPLDQYSEKQLEELDNKKQYEAKVQPKASVPK